MFAPTAESTQRRFFPWVRHPLHNIDARIRISELTRSASTLAGR
jgi:hypothetical protein